MSRDTLTPEQEAAVVEAINDNWEYLHDDSAEPSIYEPGFWGALAAAGLAVVPAGDGKVVDIESAAAYVAEHFDIAYSDDDEAYPKEYWRELVRGAVAAALGRAKCALPGGHDGDCIRPWIEVVAPVGDDAEPDMDEIVLAGGHSGAVLAQPDHLFPGEGVVRLSAYDPTDESVDLTLCDFEAERLAVQLIESIRRSRAASQEGGSHGE